MTDTAPSVIVVEHDGSTKVVDLVGDIVVVHVVADPAIEVIEVTIPGGGGGGTISGVTATALTSSLNPSVLNQNVTFTATVTGGGLPVPTGVVTFYRGGGTIPITTLPVNLSGVTSVTIATLVGVQGITARYNANAMLAASTSPAVTQTVVSPPVTATALTSTPNPTDSGAAVTFTATTTSGGVPVTVGTMSFKRGANNMAVGVPVNSSGVATYTTTAIPVGAWSITAVYDGLQTFQTSTSDAVSQAVVFAGGPVVTTVTLTSDDASSGLGQLVTLTATAKAAATGVAVNSGTITFKDGGAVITTAPVNTVTGSATYVSSTLPTGTHVMTADYLGAPVYTAATSNTINQIVSAGGGSAVTAQTMWLSKPTARLGEVVTMRTQIKSGINTVVQTGTVTFKDGATTLATGTPINGYGESSFTTTALGLGAHSITADYVGAPDFENDVSGAIVCTVVATLPTPTEPTWEGAFNSGSLQVITDWFHYNTGHLSEGWDPAGLWNPAGVGATDWVIVTPAWLTANAAPGKVVNDGGGHWTVTGLHTGQIRIHTSHVLFSHCWVDRQDYEHVWGGATYVYDPSITSDTDVTNVDIKFDHCTFSTDGTGAEGTYGDVSGFTPISSVGFDEYVISYSEATQWTAVFKYIRGSTANYNWVHDLDLFGFSPHNTSASIRGDRCKLFRNLFCDGTSSNVSLYADLAPYTDFYLTENVCWVKPDHASGEINFPIRGTGWSPLSPGYVRELCGNKLERGASGDNNYFSKVTDNTLITGEPLFGGADTVQISGVPTVLAGTGQLTDALPSLHYTPTTSSTQLYFHGLGQAGHIQPPNVVFTDESGAAWFLVPGCETPVEAAPAGTIQYGLSASLWTQETAGPQAFRRVIVDPYTTNSVGYQYGLIIELTGITGLTLAQPAVKSARGADQPWGAILPSITTGTLASNCTTGNLVMAFITTIHEEIGQITAPVGWHVLGNPREPRVSATCLWRTDFTGRSLTVPDLSDSAGTAVTILCEFDIT